MSISIVIPAYNEQDNITEVINKIRQSLDIEYEIIIVNDHSTDRTPQIASGLAKEYPNIRLIDNSAESGFANALKTGFSTVKNEIVVPVMADSCDDLNSIKVMFAKLNEGYDIVCGSRYIKGGVRLGDSRLKGFFSYFIGCSLHYLLGLPTHDIANAFKIYRKYVLDRIDIRSRSFEVSMEIPLKAYFLGFRITEVPTVWSERTRGKSNFDMLKLFPEYLKLYLWAIFKKITG